MSQAQLKLSMSAISIYVVLMGKDDPVDSKELAAALGVQKVPSDGLTKLKQAQLIDIGKVPVGRGNTYRLSGEGWARCMDVLASAPKTQGSAPHALLALTHALHKGFSDHPGLTPRQFFVTDRAKEPPPGGASDVEGQIRKAYAQLSRRPGEWVPLADLRERLAHVGRTEVDRALESLAMQRGVHLIPWDNRKALTDRDHESALRLGGDDNHRLRIESV
jgi:hypothetical protein